MVKFNAKITQFSKFKGRINSNTDRIIAKRVIKFKITGIIYWQKNPTLGNNQMLSTIMETIKYLIPV